MGGRLEVCIDSVESAVLAWEGGADGLEVCSNLIIGGTTPGVSQFKQIRQACDIELTVLIRPRFGDFLYTDAEFKMMKEDIRMFRELGADGITVGCLKPDGSLDMSRMEEIKDCAGRLRLTLHRAFDVCENPHKVLEEAVLLGIDTILTSGQACDCVQGTEALRRLIIQAGERIEILVGGGVNAEVIRRLHEEIHAASFHMSGKKRLDSGMVYRNESVHMGLPGLSEFDIFRTDREQIKKARYIMDTYVRQENN